MAEPAAPVRSTLRTYTLTLTTGHEFLIALADADMHEAALFLPGRVAAVPVYARHRGEIEEPGTSPPALYRWRMARVPSSAIVAIVPCPPELDGRRVPVPPVRIDGWASGTDDDSILLEFGSVTAPKGARGGIIRP